MSRKRKKKKRESAKPQENVLKNIRISVTHFMENDSPVILPVIGSRNASFKQQSVGGPTSYLIPTVFTNSCSYVSTSMEQHYFNMLTMGTSTLKYQAYE